jgi:chromosome segregation ATPase
MKSNMEYLREFIKDNPEAIEFWDAVSRDIEESNDEIKELKSDIQSKENFIEELEEKNEELSSELANYEDNFEEIDCGIGTIIYKNPYNLKLQMMMEEFKEHVEKVAYT